ncbi:uncharacterized protein LOC144122031 isoform X2 [Amblyomma americanum]
MQRRETCQLGDNVSADGSFSLDIFDGNLSDAVYEHCALKPVVKFLIVILTLIVGRVVYLDSFRTSFYLRRGVDEKLAMNKLVYCNNCFAQPTRTSLFFVTSCAHVFCQGCKDDCTRSKCKICNAACSTAALSQNMSPDVRELFKDPKIIMQKATMIAGFQVSQLSGLSAYLRQQVDSLKTSLKAATDNGIKYKQQNERLRKEVAALKGEVKKLKDEQSPGIEIGQSPTFLTRPDYPIPPAFETPPVAALGQRTPRMQAPFSIVSSYTPSRPATTMTASMDMSQQRSHRAYAHDDRATGRSMVVAQVTPTFGRSPRERRSLPGSDSSLSSSYFRTPSTDSQSMYSASSLSAAPNDRRGDSKTYFNQSVRFFDSC